jgi:hypothetical protein
MNPVSFAELSCQVRLIWLEEVAEVERFDGAAGNLILAAWAEGPHKRMRPAAKHKNRTGVD